MKQITKGKLSIIALYFGLIKTTMTNNDLHTQFFVQLINEILSLKTFVFFPSFFISNPNPISMDFRRDATILVGISKALETYSESLK